MLVDEVNNFTPERCISAITQTNADTAIVSQIIDLAAKDSATFYGTVGTLSDANATFAFKLEESANSDMSSATDVSADATKLIGTIPALTFASDDAVFSFGYKGGARYLRLTITPSGNNSGDCPIAVVFVSRNKKIGSGPTGS